jgi:hypothetical protein
VLGLVLLGLEVEVVGQRVVSTLADGCENDGEVKLSPALLVDTEWGLLECCDRSALNARAQTAHAALTLSRVRECRVQVVDGLLKDIGHVLVALVVQEPHLDAP